ncbi:MAG: hypothetical protein ABSE70_03385 [Candidatus Limnocylindrales bacterium]
MNNTSATRPSQFLADLAQAMRSTAENARQATIEQCNSNAKAYIEHLQAQTDGGAPTLRQAAEADVAAIRDWSKSQMERIRVETEQRIARRRELLEQDLQEYSSAVEGELEHVQQRVQTFEADLARSLDQLMEVTDPTEFANLAAQMPGPPAFGEPDPTALVNNLRLGGEQTLPEEAEPEPEEKAALPDHWWLDSPTALTHPTEDSSEPG